MNLKYIPSLSFAVVSFIIIIAGFIKLINNQIFISLILMGVSLLAYICSQLDLIRMKLEESLQ